MIFIREKIIGAAFIAFFATCVAMAQSVWSDGAGDQTWSTPGNWQGNAVPTSVTNVQIGTQPTGDQIGVDTGSTTIASLAFNSSLTGASTITGFQSSDTLTVNGAITNNSSATQGFLLPIFAGASATWSGSLTYGSNVGIGANQITLAGTNAFSGLNLNFDITNTSTYGNFIVSGTATFTSNVHININSSYVFVGGETFDFTSGSFGSATIGTLPTLTAGLSWNTSSFISSGVLSVVSAIPEPSAYAAIFGAAAIGFGIWRKRRKA